MIWALCRLNFILATYISSIHMHDDDNNDGYIYIDLLYSITCQRLRHIENDVHFSHLTALMSHTHNTYPYKLRLNWQNKASINVYILKQKFAYVRKMHVCGHLQLLRKCLWKESLQRFWKAISQKHRFKVMR